MRHNLVVLIPNPLCNFCSATIYYFISWDFIIIVEEVVVGLLNPRTVPFPLMSALPLSCRGSSTTQGKDKSQTLCYDTETSQRRRPHPVNGCQRHQSIEWMQPQCHYKGVYNKIVVDILPAFCLFDFKTIIIIILYTAYYFCYYRPYNYTRCNFLCISACITVL